MNKKLVFRILGALASALIIVSVFVPFVSVTGYSVSLWESFESTSSLYLPIMIIVFGAIGVVFFSLNIKTEFAYMSFGALVFFLVIETIDIINQDAFNTLGVGYYFLVIGTILTGIMAFLTNLKSNKTNNKVKEEEIQLNEPSMINKIDKLYNDQENTVQNEISPIQPIDNVVTPIPVQPLETVNIQQPIPDVNQISQQPIVNNNLVETTQGSPVQEVPSSSQTVVSDVVTAQQVVAPNPVVQEFTNQVPTQNPVVQEFTNQTINQNTNPQSQAPVLNQVSSQPVVQPQPVNTPDVTNIPLSSTNEPVAPNPVVQEFTNPGSAIAPQSNTNNLDIFGQPINK